MIKFTKKDYTITDGLLELVKLQSKGFDKSALYREDGGFMGGGSTVFIMIEEPLPDCGITLISNLEKRVPPYLNNHQSKINIKDLFSFYNMYCDIRVYSKKVEGYSVLNMVVIHPTLFPYLPDKCVYFNIPMENFVEGVYGVTVDQVMAYCKLTITTKNGTLVGYLEPAF